MQLIFPEIIDTYLNWSNKEFPIQTIPFTVKNNAKSKNQIGYRLHKIK